MDLLDISVDSEGNSTLRKNLALSELSEAIYCNWR
jgi:hypothetical protein